MVKKTLHPKVANVLNSLNQSNLLLSKKLLPVKEDEEKQLTSPMPEEAPVIRTTFPATFSK